MTWVGATLRMSWMMGWIGSKCGIVLHTFKLLLAIK